MKLQRQHFLLSYLKTLSVGPVGASNSRPSASQPGAQPSERPVRGDIATKGTIPSGLKVYGSDRVSDNQCFIHYVIII